MADWQNDLGAFFEEKEQTHAEQERSEVERFLTDVAMPAYEQLRAELEKYGRDVSIRETANAAALIVQHEGADEFHYSLQGRTFPEGVLPFAVLVSRERKGIRMIRTESMLRSGSDYALADITSDEVIAHFLTHYKRSIREE
jgi:choline/glycine/proline betaine transport protein